MVLDDILVTFAHASPGRFDIVIGADGLHPGIRKLSFDTEPSVYVRLGTYLSVFTSEKLLGLDQ